jgi:hypothetical protein
MVEVRVPAYLDCDVAGFEWLGRLAALLNTSGENHVVLKGRLNWFEGQMCAPLGALLQKASLSGKMIDVQQRGRHRDSSLGHQRVLELFWWCTDD